MGGEGLETLACPHIPDANTLVETAAHHQVALGVEVTAKCVVGMSFESLETLAGAKLPYLESLVIGGGDQQSGVRAPSHI